MFISTAVRRRITTPSSIRAKLVAPLHDVVKNPYTRLNTGSSSHGTKRRDVYNDDFMDKHVVCEKTINNLDNLQSDDEPDSGFSSLESVEGNLPQFELLYCDDISQRNAIVAGSSKQSPVTEEPVKVQIDSEIQETHTDEPVISSKGSCPNDFTQDDIYDDDVAGSSHQSAVTNEIVKTQVDTEIQKVKSNEPVKSTEYTYYDNITLDDAYEYTTTKLSEESAERDLLEICVTDFDVDCAEVEIPPNTDTPQEPELVSNPQQSGFIETERDTLLNVHDSNVIIDGVVDFESFETERKTAFDVHESGINVDSGIDLESFDTNVGKAIETSVVTNSLSPLIKEELKCVIQCRRLQSGKPEYIVEPEEPKQYTLREDEVRKRFARLEQNRRSAKKARHRERKTLSELQEYLRKAEKAREDMEEMASQLRKERDELAALLKVHGDWCRPKLQLTDAQRKNLEYQLATVIFK